MARTSSTDEFDTPQRFLVVIYHRSTGSDGMVDAGVSHADVEWQWTISPKHRQLISCTFRQIHIGNSCHAQFGHIARLGHIAQFHHI